MTRGNAVALLAVPALLAVAIGVKLLRRARSRRQTLPGAVAHAELALWLGVAPSELATVLPNIKRFDTPGSGAPVGFLGGGQPVFADGFESGDASAWSAVG